MILCFLVMLQLRHNRNSSRLNACCAVFHNDYNICTDFRKLNRYFWPFFAFVNALVTYVLYICLRVLRCELDGTASLDPLSSNPSMIVSSACTDH